MNNPIIAESSTDLPSVYVVIPYYQRDGELLARAIRSVLNQTNAPQAFVIIVDDSSPYPAENVLAEHFPNASSLPLRIIKQTNAGASAARNSGLAAVPIETTFVAFLDSDDEWVPDHLNRALTALNTHGSDFYFADHQRDDWAQNKFAMRGFTPSDHACLDADLAIFRYVGDPLLAILCDHLIQTSTVMLRWQLIRDLRFRTDLIMGEDELFWISAIRSGKHVAFGMGLGAQLHSGINISQNVTQDLFKEMRLLEQNLYFWKHLPEYLPGESSIHPLRKARMHQLSRNFAAATLSFLKKEKRVPLAALARFTRLSPDWLSQLIGLLMQHFSTRLAMKK